MININEHVYCTECKNIKYVLNCINKVDSTKKCDTCPCKGCNCYDIEDSRTDRPNYIPKIKESYVLDFFEDFLIENGCDIENYNDPERGIDQLEAVLNVLKELINYKNKYLKYYMVYK